MKLLTKEILKRLPALKATDNIKDPTVQVKFFTPDSSWTWYATEYSPEERLFFGWAIDRAYPDGAELGYFSLDELKSVRGLLGLPIERDMHFPPTKLSEVIKKEAR